MELCTCEKAVFFLPVNILTVWCAGFLELFVLFCNTLIECTFY